MTFSNLEIDGMTQSLPHLKLKLATSGIAKSRSFPRTLAPETEENLHDRQAHGEKLRQSLSPLVSKPTNSQESNQQEDEPYFSNSVPLLIRADSDIIHRDSLKACGIEVLTELDDGYVVAVAEPGLSGLQKTIDLFVSGERGGNKISGLWEILDAEQRLQYILSPNLSASWHQLVNDQRYEVDVGIACDGLYSRSAQPAKQADETDEGYLKRFDRWMTKQNQQLHEQQILQTTRVQEFRSFLADNAGEIRSRLSGSAVLPDSVSCRIQISGRGLKELVFNFPYLFEVTEVEEVAAVKSSVPNGVFEISSFPLDRFPPNALDEIVALHIQPSRKICLHSVTVAAPCRKFHMSAWAATIDYLAVQKDALFIVPAGRVSSTDRPIASPAQSLQTLTVGSISRSMAEQKTVSTVARWESGMWDTIKPEVVELEPPDRSCSEVLSIAQAVAATYPTEPCLLYRALLVHSARWSSFAWAKGVQPAAVLCRVGYGVPDLERAIGNAPNRVTYLTQGEQQIKARQAHIYQVSLSPLLNKVDDLEILLEVTLSYKALPARTRRVRS